MKLNRRFLQLVSREGRARLFVGALFAVSVALSGCSLNTTKKQYVLAEKLWTEGNYPAAVSEFDKVYLRDPHGKLGRQALYRAASTQAYFLSQYADAIGKFRTFSQLTDDPSAAWDAQKQIGEILFAKMELYDQAIQHYRMMLKKRPEADEAPLFFFRIAKSHFFLWQFDDAVKAYQDLAKTYPGTAWAEKATYEIGVTYYTRGEHQPGALAGNASKGNADSYQEAIDAFEKFIQLFPKSELVSQAKFGIASCLEEMDQVDAALHAYQALKPTYPAPKVIEIKIHRLRERKSQRSR